MLGHCDTGAKQYYHLMQGGEHYCPLVITSFSLVTFARYTETMRVSVSLQIYFGQAFRG